jgi:hypothetical protein
MEETAKPKETRSKSSASVTVNYMPPDGLKFVTLESPIMDDPFLSGFVSEGDQVVFPEEINVDKNLKISGEPGVWDIWVITYSDGIIYTTK